MFKKILLPAALLFSSVTAYADAVYFEASVNKRTVSLNESFVYSITVNGGGVNLPEHKMDALPDFNRFGKSASQSISVINGKTSVSVTHSYTLAPKRTGKFTIQPAEIAFNGKTYLTESIEIEVIPAQSVQNIPVGNNQQQPLQNTSGKAFVKASVDKKTAYENEKLVYKFSFYTNVDLASNPEYYPPDFSGFWNDGSKLKSHFEVVDGLNYRVDEMETVLYPVGTGIKTILPAKLKVSVMDFSASSIADDFFNFFADMKNGQTKVLETNAIEIKVIPVPQEGKPSDFSGAIGDFKIKASIDKKDVNTNEPVTLTVIVSGSGNMKSVSNINFGVYDSFKKYDTIIANASGNSKKFKTIFIPLMPGEKEIPAVSLSFFNPVKKQYETIKTSPQKITVSGMAVYPKENVEDKSKINMVRKDINCNKHIKTLEMYKGYLIEKPAFYLIFAPFIILLVLSACYKMYVDKISRNPLKKLKVSHFAGIQKLIKKAEVEISENNFEAAMNLVYKALIEIINIETSVVSDNLQRDKIAYNLRVKGANDEKIAEIINMLERFDFYKFASVNLDKDSANALLNDVKTLTLNLKK
ncbi:MAG: BatD family protein [Endomicrobium sp.]|nr:BatD family protein [Endomicrobium sp.]